MAKTILLVSRDPILQETRALILERVGYRTIKAATLKCGIMLSRGCQMCVIGHSFEPHEQAEFIERAHEANPGMFVVCLRFGLINPERLLKTVAECFAAQPGSSQMRVVGPA